jgi:gamma-glutamylcyclotransferase (GGCT)/AIG2-like uncharacterized protein YtfP
VKCDLIFVYGTLRPGFDAYPLLQKPGAHYVGKGSVCGELVELSSFPGALKPGRTGAGEASEGEADESGSSSRQMSSADGHPRYRVIGDIFRLLSPARAFKLLDRYEGFRPALPGESLFIRELTEVRLENGNRVTAWIYWLNRLPKRARRIRSGDYSDKTWRATL